MAARHPLQNPRDDATADHEDENQQQSDFEDRPTHGYGNGGQVGLLALEEHGQEHQHQHREQILDDQPANGNVASRGVELLVVGQYAEEDHSAGDGHGQAEDQPRCPAPSQGHGDATPQHGRGHALAQGTRDGDLTDRHQFVEMELQPDAEHQQDDADMSQFLGQMLIGHEAGRMRANGDSCQEVANDGRQVQGDG